MAKFIRIEEIEDSQRTYLQYLEELKIRLIMHELELLILGPQVEQNRELEDFSDDENWYSE